jgi:hypothetical protein
MVRYYIQGVSSSSLSTVLVRASCSGIIVHVADDDLYPYAHAPLEHVHIRVIM